MVENEIFDQIDPKSLYFCVFHKFFRPCDCPCLRNESLRSIFPSPCMVPHEVIETQKLFYESKFTPVIAETMLNWQMKLILDKFWIRRSTTAVKYEITIIWFEVWICTESYRERCMPKTMKHVITFTETFFDARNTQYESSNVLTRKTFNLLLTTFKHGQRDGWNLIVLKLSDDMFCQICFKTISSPKLEEWRLSMMIKSWFDTIKICS